MAKQVTVGPVLASSHARSALSSTPFGRPRMKTEVGSTVCESLSPTGAPRRPPAARGVGLPSPASSSSSSIDWAPPRPAERRRLPTIAPTIGRTESADCGRAAVRQLPVCLSLQNMVGGGLSAEDAAQRKSFEPYHSKAVPRSQDLRASAKQGLRSQDASVTTLMLRNIPNKYAQSTLLEEIDEMGFAGTYDFFYLPMDVQNRSNVGYAFINFRLPAYAQRFYAMFSEHRFRKHPSRKISNVSAAHVQGLDANLKHFENRAVTHARNNEYRPVVLSGSKRIDFAEAVAATHARAPGLVVEGASSSSASSSVAAASEYPRRGMDEALRGRPVSRQVSDGSNSTASSAALPAGPPPGLEGVRACMGWARQTSAPEATRPPPSPPPRVLTLSDVGALVPPGLNLPRPRAMSDGGVPMVSDEDPAYVPLPTIPSVSKIFAACHTELDDPLDDIDGDFLEAVGCSAVAEA
mmetsp:Transcript_54228/g.156702  ORF Transcript_54228/g.156702 Transcript_54228/m.156702 type:complete len:465 (+) Transcript_54228:2223-3617(+)